MSSPTTLTVAASHSLDMRDKLRRLFASVASPRETSSWSQLHAVPPMQAVTKRAASHLICSGDRHKRCGFSDLYAVQFSISRDIFELLDAEHTKLSVARQKLHSEDMFMKAWRYKRDAKAFHKAVQVRVDGCAMLATRTPRVTGSAQGYAPPAINLSPPSPSIHPTYISCDASASEADDSFNLHTPTDSEFSHDGLEDRKFLEDCYPVLKARQSLDFSPSLDVIVEKPSPELDHHDFHVQRIPLSEIEEHCGEEAMITIEEVISSPATRQQEPCSADVPQSPSDDELKDGDDTPSSSSGDELTAELMTAEIMVGTPATSGPASCVESKPDMCIGVDYDNPAEYIDMYLYGYGVDPREYWGVTGSLSRATLKHIADLFRDDGLLAGISILESLLRPTTMFINSGMSHEAESVISYTTELVSPSDSLVTSPGPALAGAIGEIVCAPNTDILEPHAMSAGAEDADSASILAEPYGPSRSTTVDDQLVGEAPHAHLGDQLAFMMQHLPSPVSPMALASPVTPKSSRPTVVGVASEVKQERPRLWDIRNSPQPTIIDLPTTPTSDDTTLGLAL
ncbi:hypothetical protein PHLGIDRAFT_19424 [Phlebiopsis gigantea 11061_1 CR5-6]|uniref:Uncharacterized protein n=1 Tax=Phlebiopsis gigantea (strain 11061_1 CR5-6) TaxID=745531 RepID=A0A0C3RXF0_PHLG1|nr:hypothetical protein PHLGIDRAFT_19424 [Phlebiopsis gigantea 11061_1 CR5-6]